MLRDWNKIISMNLSEKFLPGSKENQQMANRLAILTGAPGSGKDDLVGQLKQQEPTLLYQVTIFSFGELMYQAFENQLLTLPVGNRYAMRIILLSNK